MQLRHEMHHCYGNLGGPRGHLLSRFLARLADFVRKHRGGFLARLADFVRKHRGGFLARLADFVRKHRGAFWVGLGTLC